MRILFIPSLLFLVPVLVAGSPQLSASSTTSVSPPNPTICGSIVNQDFTVVYATDAYDCLRSVPFHSAVASQLIQYINETIQFQSTLAYLANPPPGYQQPAVDLEAGLVQIQRDIDRGVFQNEHDFEVSLSRLLNAAHDDHLYFSGGILSAFVFGSPYDIVSVSKDGIELPKVYIADELPIDGWDSLSYQPSAIAKINDQDVVEYLDAFAARNSFGKLEPHSDWNMLMRSGALDTQGILEVFFGGAMFYPGDTIKLTFENGSVVGPDRWQAVYTGPPYTGPLQTGGDFYNFFVLGLYPASYEEPTATSTPLPLASSDTPSSTVSWWDLAYPTPEPVSQGFPDDAGLPRIFFMKQSSVAVLSITQFSAYGEMIHQFVDIVKTFLRRSKEVGLMKVVIDVQQNKGGNPLLAIEVFKLFFPSLDPVAPSRRRAHPMADALGNIITSYWQNLTTNESDYDYLSTDEWMIADRLDARTEENYTSWDDYFRSTIRYGGDNFTNVEEYDLTNTFFTLGAASLAIDNLNKSANQPYAAQDIIILSDGLCSSACALFMELMKHQGQVRTVVVGGRPDYTPMQAPGGTRGAAVYDTQSMDTDISHALAIDNFSTALPHNRRSDFFVKYASINLRDQVRRDDPLKVPLQFRYEAADCRIFFTPSTWYNYSNLWNYAVEAMWINSTLCIANSTTNSTQLYPSSTPTPYKAYNPESNSFTKREASEEDMSNTHYLDNPLNDILDGAVPIPRQNGVPCSSDCECGPQYTCQEVSVYGKEWTTKQKQCMAYCQIGSGSQPCASGYYCRPYDEIIKTSLKIDRRISFQYGYCVPKSPICNYLGCTGSLPSTIAEDGSCMAAVPEGHSLHCFPFVKNCVQKCYAYSPHHGLDFMPIYCTRTELHRFQEQLDVHEYKFHGSKVYWNPYVPTPLWLIPHNDDEATWLHDPRDWTPPWLEK